MWKPCRNKVTPPARRCRDCQDALITCPSAHIRRALAAEPNQDPYVLESLASDSDITVSATAQRNLTGTKAIWTEDE